MRRKHDARRDDVEGIAQRLRSERPEASPLELDRIKSSVMARAKAATGSRVGARRLAVVGLTAGLMLATTGGVLAGQGGDHSSGNAAIAQYGNNCDVGNGNGTGNGNGGNGNSNGNNNDNCNENSFNNTTTNVTNNNTTNIGGTVNNYTTVTSPAGNVLGAKSSKPTTSLRHIKIHVNVPRGAHISKVSVKVNGKRLKTIRGKRASGNIELSDLPCGKGATTVVVTVTLSNGQTVSAHHTYHLCTAG